MGREIAGIETRERILKAGLKLLNRFGYGSLTVSELARKTKISKQRLFYHFPNPEDILLELAKQWSQTGQQCTLEALANTRYISAEKVLSIADGMFDWMKKYPELSKLALVLFQTGTQIPRLKIFTDEARETGRKRIKELLQQSKTYSAMKNREIEDRISALHSCMYGAFFYVAAMDDFANVDKHRENCKLALLNILGGV